MTWVAERVAKLLAERSTPLASAARDLAIERAHLAAIVDGTRHPNANLTTRLAKYFDEQPETWLEHAPQPTSGAPTSAHPPRTTGFVRAACVGDVPEGEVRVVCEGRVALVHTRSAFYAVSNICPHAGGQIGEGFLDDEYVLECPWHAGRWDVRTGRMLTAVATADVATYPVRISGRDIEVEVPGGPDDPG